MAFAVWRTAWDPEGARRIGESRWWFDRGTAHRRGLTKEEWLDRWARWEHALAKWFGIPALITWFAACGWLIARGLGA
jgi:hypothetical protein